MLDTGRFESFSDGVFAFAATLLVEAIALHPGSPRREWPWRSTSPSRST